MATVIRSETHPDIRSYADVNRDVLRLLAAPGRTYYIIFAITLVVLGIGAVAWLTQVVLGIGMSGLLNPVGWGVYITTFVFWIGIGHAGTLISAILFLFRARWRQSIYRIAEAMTVFAVMTAGLFPIIHLGRPWIFYYLLPYPNQRELWPNFRSPLLWDVFAVSTYLTVSTTFFILGMVPDIAAARDSTTVPWRKKLYTVMALGWRGTASEWRHFSKAYLYLAGLATPLVISVHSVVSWDFAMSIVPGWHATIFAPYFVAGAIFSGLALVVTLAIPIRKIFNLEAYFTPRHFDAIGKLILVSGMVVFYAYITEFFMAWYSFKPAEQDVFWNRVVGDYWWATWIMLICNGIIPMMLWWPSIRKNLAAMFVISVFINIGMWFERFVIIVTSLSHEYAPWQWRNYQPSLVEMLIVLGSFAWFWMWFMLFLRLFPVVAVAELKEVLPAPGRGTRARNRPARHGGTGPAGDTGA
jgi:molybdopterin-containing oxidoreductase family membrane subunit